jgi:uncharacterized membrane protein YedE/YeeE
MSTIRALAALAAGAIFGFGLALSGMLDPARIRGFLDFFGDFDASLAFVFVGAVAVSSAGYLISRRLPRPALAEKFELPTKSAIDTPLLAGAAVFGLGWGMAGFCPGPAIAALSLGLPPVFVFTVLMLLGMIVHDVTRRATRLDAPAGAMSA